jgi:hypothetical protein
MGGIDARELYDRFSAVMLVAEALPDFSATTTTATATVSTTAANDGSASTSVPGLPSPASTQPESLASAGLRPISKQESDTLFKEMALLIPIPDKRLQMINQCQDVSVGHNIPNSGLQALACASGLLVRGLPWSHVLLQRGACMDRTSYVDVEGIATGNPAYIIARLM